MIFWFVFLHYSQLLNKIHDNCETILQDLRLNIGHSGKRLNVIW